MTVRDAISSYSRGELAPQKNTFVQPGTYGDNPDTAMTDGVKDAMLKAQRETESKLKSPRAVRRHLLKHHRIASLNANPLSVHANQHMVGVMNQGHSVSGGQLVHGSTDIGAGTSNFARAAEAPPLVELIRHVRTPEGSQFFKMSIGTPIIGSEEGKYQEIKAANAAAEKEEDLVKSEKEATTHSALLAARKDARAKYPPGHPERLAAERAVRTSRRTSSYRDAKDAQAHVSDKKKASDARKDPGFYSPSERVIANGGSTHPAGVDGVISHVPPEVRAPVPSQEQVATRLDEISRLSPGEKSRYYAMRTAGVMHPTAMANISRQRERPAVPPKVATQVRSRRRKG